MPTLDEFLIPEGPSHDSDKAFIESARLLLPQARRIIAAIVARADRDGMVYSGGVEYIAAAILVEPPEERKR